MSLSIKGIGSNRIEKIGADKDIVGAAVPDLGIKLGEFFQAGLTAAYTAENHAGFKGAVDVGLALGGSMPDASALITADIVNPANSKQEGWEKLCLPRLP